MIRTPEREPRGECRINGGKRKSETREAKGYFSCVCAVEVRFEGYCQFNGVDFSVGEEQNKIRAFRW